MTYNSTHSTVSRVGLWSLYLAVGCLLAASRTAIAQVPQPVPDDGPNQTEVQGRSRGPLPPLPESLSKLVVGAHALNEQRTVLLDRRKGRIFLHTEVACRNCVLEMLCVPNGEREHETILNLRSQASVVHAGLLALNLEPGKPAIFYPDFHPPTGPKLELRVHWVDANGKQLSEDARSWIRHSVNRYFSEPLAAAPPGVKLPHEELRYDPYNKEILWYGPMTKKQRQHLLTLWDDDKYQNAIRKFYKLGQSRSMTADFVFTGSRWDFNEVTGKRHYAAEQGHFITVANFPSSTIDIAEASSASAGGQTYEAWRERIPPVGTPVLLEIKEGGKPGKNKPSPSNKTPPQSSTSDSSPSPKGTP